MINKKSMAALAAAVVITVGGGASSYAWFTSTAVSQSNTFRAGTLSIDGTTWDTNLKTNGAGDYTAALGNLQPLDSKDFKFTISNKLSTGAVSTLDAAYQIDLENKHTEQDGKDLMGAAKFRIYCDNAEIVIPNVEPSTDGYTFDQIRKYFINNTGVLQSNGNNEVKKAYKITVKIPEDTDNTFQGALGKFDVNISATQNIAGAKNANFLAAIQ